ncbi:MAG: porin [Sulfuricaulis sp.]|nr:porin [Sulfuricaulis sp.]
MSKKIVGILGISLVWQVLPAMAATGLEGVSLSGFLTAGATYADKQLLTNSNAVSQDGSIESTPGFTADSRLGVQISAKVNQDVSITGQLLAKAREDNSNVKADWAFVTYRVNEPVSIRAGKIKFPTFLISDYYEVGYAYPWIRPPQEVYSLNPISALNGLDMLAKLRFGDMTLLFQPYFGVSRGATTVAPQEALSALGQAAGSIYNVGFTADELHGFNLSLSSDIFTVRLGALKTQVNASSLGVFSDETKFSSAGVAMDWKNIVLYSEVAKREIEGSANFAFPNQKASYATLGYRFGKWLPLFTTARISDNGNPKTLLGTPLKQSSKTLGLRYEVGSGSALKFEAQKITPDKGTRGLLIANPNGAAVKDKGDHVMFYGITIDVVF